MSDLDRLRHLLLEEERDALARAVARLEELDQASRNLPAHLPGMVRAAPTSEMADALATPVAAALGNAVRDNSTSIVDALFPVIGPLIRKAIAEALRGLMSDLNGALEHNFTLHGLKWRLEALRGGVPYAQVVLKHSLRYRIDHVFLIERDSGLVLHRESSSGVPDLDADAIAGMLTAIGQFVRDSVGHGSSDSLEEARVGEYLVWLIEGPRASIACFVQGAPPDVLRTLLVQRLEQIHMRLGGISPAETSILARANLDPAELVRLSAPAPSARAQPSRVPAVILLLVALVGTGWYVVRQQRWQHRVESVRTALVEHPGFVLTGLESEAWRSLTISGLLDSDAEPLETVLARADVGDARTHLQLDGYISSDDAVVLARARRLLVPPTDVATDMRDGTLILSGGASRTWIDEARARAPWIAGVRSVAFDVHEDVDPGALARVELNALARDIEAMNVLFVRDVEPDTAAGGRVIGIVAALTRAQALAVEARIRLRVQVDGFNDRPGSGEVNAELRQSRARWLIDALIAHGIAAEWLRDADAHVEAPTATMTIRGARVRLLQDALPP